MAISVKKIELWRREVANQPGALAETLEPLANSGANLKVVMGYRFPGNESRAAIEVYPVTSDRAAAAARRGGLERSDIPTLLVEGDNRAGLGHSFARALADEGINIQFLVAHVIGDRYVAVIGFGSDSDADRAVTVLRRAAAAGRRPAARAGRRGPVRGGRRAPARPRRRPAGRRR